MAQRPGAPRRGAFPCRAASSFADTACRPRDRRDLRLCGRDAFPRASRLSGNDALEWRPSRPGPLSASEGRRGGVIRAAGTCCPVANGQADALFRATLRRVASSRGRGSKPAALLRPGAQVRPAGRRETWDRTRSRIHRCRSGRREYGIVRELQRRAAQSGDRRELLGERLAEVLSIHRRTLNRCLRREGTRSGRARTACARGRARPVV